METKLKAKRNIKDDSDTWQLIKIYRRNFYYNYDSAEEKRYIRTHRRRIAAANGVFNWLGLITPDPKNPVGFKPSYLIPFSKRSMVGSKKTRGSEQDHRVFEQSPMPQIDSMSRMQAFATM